jgi:hypothetical protein
MLAPVAPPCAAATSTAAWRAPSEICHSSMVGAVTALAKSVESESSVTMAEAPDTDARACVGRERCTLPEPRMVVVYPLAAIAGRSVATTVSATGHAMPGIV